MSRPLLIDSVESAYLGQAEMRRERAADLALAALQDLEKNGIDAWIIGSLAKGRFTCTSDVDFVVQCERTREYDAFRIIEKAMAEIPFDLVPFSTIDEDSLPFMLEGALDASGLIAR